MRSGCRPSTLDCSAQNNANPSEYRYFSMSANVSISSWTTHEEDALKDCGHCDNCARRGRGDVGHKDVTIWAWKILKIADAIQTMRGKVTLNQLVTIVRGNGGGKFGTKSGKGHQKTEGVVDPQAVAGGVVELSAKVCPSPKCCMTQYRMLIYFVGYGETLRSFAAGRLSQRDF